ncbi:LysR family transcriptional regulator [Endozoicomonas lisbonensis]|uniref:DNA-binding transcriptional LysR family regulator n=1 Tax=Endozoicomonas lisbonensis TaxID=3120522 RepID=A0ABV2SDY0_9GAMM
MNFSTFDLNLLKALLILLQEKNTNRAAERLNTSQPAVSRTLAKLRKELNDPLFVRQSRNMTLTPRAEEIALQLPRIMDSLEQTLQLTRFDPSQQTGKLSLALNGFIIESHGYQIYQAVREVAPQLQLQLHSYSQETVSQLINGEIDAAVNFYPLDISKELRQVPVAELTFGLLCRSGHPLANKRIEKDEVFTAELATLIIPDHNLRRLSIQKYADARIKVEARFRSQQLNPIIKALETSDMLFVAPVCLLKELNDEKFSRVYVNCHEDILKQKVGLIYNHRHSASCRFDWLQNLVIDTLSK